MEAGPWRGRNAVAPGTRIPYYMLYKDIFFPARHAVWSGRRREFILMSFTASNEGSTNGSGAPCVRSSARGTPCGTPVVRPVVRPVVTPCGTPCGTPKPHRKDHSAGASGSRFLLLSSLSDTPVDRDLGYCEYNFQSVLKGRKKYEFLSYIYVSFCYRQDNTGSTRSARTHAQQN